MSPDMIVSMSSAELADAYPQASPEERRRIRKRAHNAIWQRRYRAQGRDSSNPYLGSFDGPPIDRCETQERLLEDARIGSARLKVALDYAGLRP